MDFFAFDKAYIDRLRNADPATENHFFTYFERFLNIKLRARSLRSDQVEDLKQETLLRTIAAVRRGGGIRQPERFGAFVNSICNNTLMDYYRSLTKNKPLEDAHVRTPDKTVDVEDAMVNRPSEVRVWEVLEAMPEPSREILRAIFVKDKDKDSICKAMGVDRDYLRVLLHRAKLTFKAIYSRSIPEKSDRHFTPPPGVTLYSIAESICDRETMEKIVCPLVADIQFEYREALFAGQEWRARWIRGRGWWSFFAAIGLNRILKTFVRLFLRPSSR